MDATMTTPADRPSGPAPARVTAPSKLVTWSAPAALRAGRTAVVLPVLLVVTSKVMGNPQMATYAAFGTFANLVLASFSGSRRNKLVAHLGLGLVGSILLSAGTAVRASTAAAGVVTLVVTFVVLLAGVTGPNAAAGGLAAMLAYVLSAASPGSAAMIPSRLEGWWLATAVAAVLVVLTSPRAADDRLRAMAATSARALAREAEATAAGSTEPALRAASVQAQERLRALFNASSYRPTGLATADQALGGLTELLDWVGVMIADTVADRDQIGPLGHPQRELLRGSAEVLDAVASTLLGGDAVVDIERLDRLRQDSAGAVRHLGGDGPQQAAALHASFHARTIAMAVRSVAADAVIATGRAGRLPGGDEGRRPWRPGRAPALASAAEIVSRHASVRSVWVRNSARGAVAVAAAVTVADLTNVQHGFWIVLGTLSVLRTTATATGGTALRALVGTTIGFVVGAAVIVAVGTDTTVLWAIFPVAVLVASYAPGVTPFAVGQAAFTAMLLVLYNLLVPVGWKVGVVRVEDRRRLRHQPGRRRAVLAPRRHRRGRRRPPRRLRDLGPLPRPRRGVGARTRRRGIRCRADGSRRRRPPGRRRAGLPDRAGHQAGQEGGHVGARRSRSAPPPHGGGARRAPGTGHGGAVERGPPRPGPGPRRLVHRPRRAHPRR